MYHWSISEPGPYNWRFSIKSPDNVIADLIPVSELHVRYEQSTTTLQDGNNEYIVPGPRFGEIDIYHYVEDRYLEYAEFMFEENPPPYTMELTPNLRSQSLNVFSGLRLRSMNYMALGDMQIIDTKWVFSNSAMVVDGQLVEGESEMVRGDVLEGIRLIETDPNELITMESRLNGWAKMPLPEQKLDWRKYGF